MANITHYYNQIMGHRSTASGAALQEGLEAGLTGMVFGWLGSKGKLDAMNGQAPVDLGVGAVGLLGSAFAPRLNSHTREMMRNVGAVSLGIGVFRKSEIAFGKRAAAPKAAAHGEFGSDPILEAAKLL